MRHSTPAQCVKTDGSATLLLLCCCGWVLLHCSASGPTRTLLLLLQLQQLLLPPKHASYCCCSCCCYRCCVCLTRYRWHSHHPPPGRPTSYSTQTKVHQHSCQHPQRQHDLHTTAVEDCRSGMLNDSTLHSCMQHKGQPSFTSIAFPCAPFDQPTCATLLLLMKLMNFAKPGCCWVLADSSIRCQQSPAIQQLLLWHRSLRRPGASPHTFAPPCLCCLLARSLLGMQAQQWLMPQYPDQPAGGLQSGPCSTPDQAAPSRLVMICVGSFGQLGCLVPQAGACTRQYTA